MGYENGKIYKLQHNDGHFYIGSTYATLRGRLQKHKESCIREPQRKVYKHINNEWDKVRILLIEEFSCETKQQLLKREDEYIQKELKNPLCLNCIGAVLNVEQRLEYNRQYNPQYYEEKREDIRQKQAEYYEENKEKIKEAVKEYRQENREQYLQSQREYYEKNKEEILAKMKEHRDTNKEQIQERRRIQREENKEQINARRRELRKLKKESQQQVYE